MGAANSMLKEIQVTLYDIFGYFLPGTIALLSAAAAFWAVFWPNELFNLSLDFSLVEAVLLALLAYVLGHLVQAVGNHLKSIPSVKTFLEDEFHLPAELTELLKSAVSERFNSPAAARVTAKDMYELCDQALLHSGSLGEREIFIYREGFYRGLCVSLILFAGSLLVWAIRTPGDIMVQGSWFQIGAPPTLALGALSAFGARLAFERYKRFAKYRIRTCFMRFLALKPSPPPNPKGRE